MTEKQSGNSSVWQEFVKIAEESGLITTDLNPKKQDFVGNASKSPVGPFRDNGTSKEKVESELYGVTKETGEELIGQAHPETIQIADAMGSGGVVENQVEQQKKDMEIATKMPSGALYGVHAELVKELAKKANELEEQGKIKEAMRIDLAIKRIAELPDKFVVVAADKWEEYYTKLGLFIDKAESTAKSIYATSNKNVQKLLHQYLEWLKVLKKEFPNIKKFTSYTEEMDDWFSSLYNDTRANIIEKIPGVGPDLEFNYPRQYFRFLFMAYRNWLIEQTKPPVTAEFPFPNRQVIIKEALWPALILIGLTALTGAGAGANMGFFSSKREDLATDLNDLSVVLGKAETDSPSAKKAKVLLRPFLPKFRHLSFKNKSDIAKFTQELVAFKPVLAQIINLIARVELELGESRWYEFGMDRPSRIKAKLEDVVKDIKFIETRLQKLSDVGSQVLTQQKSPVANRINIFQNILVTNGLMKKVSGTIDDATIAATKVLEKQIDNDLDALGIKRKSSFVGKIVSNGKIVMEPSKIQRILSLIAAAKSKGKS